jgi:hypothetical protein
VITQMQLNYLQDAMYSNTMQFTDGKQHVQSSLMARLAQ